MSYLKQPETTLPARYDSAQSHLVMVESETPTTPEPPPNFLLTTVYESFRRYSYLSVPAGLILSAILFSVGMLLTVPQYRARALLRVTADDKPLVFETADRSSKDSTYDLYKNTQIQLLQTPFVFSAALLSEDVATLPIIGKQSDPIHWMGENIDVGFSTKGEIMEVGFSSADERSSIVIVNAIVHAYLDEVVNLERRRRFQRLDSLELVHANSEEQLRSKQNELKILASALGTSDSESLTVAQQVAIQQLGYLQEQLSEVQFELMTAEGELELAQEAAASVVSSESTVQNESEAEHGFLEQSVSNPAAFPAQLELMSRRRELLNLERRLSEMREKHGPAHPSVTTVEKQLEVTRSVLQNETSLISNFLKSFEDLGSQRESLEDQLSLLKKRVKVLQSQEVAMESKLSKLGEDTQALGRSSVDIELMRSEIEGINLVLQDVGEEIERTKIELKTDSRVNLINEAERVIPPSQKKRYGILACFGIFGLVSPIALGIFWDISRRRIDSSEMLAADLEMPNIGMIPKVARDVIEEASFPGSREIIPNSRWRRELIALNESVRAMASIVWQIFHQDEKRVLMVSSAIEGEGKSTASVQLATALANPKLKVLLLDFDLRRPSLESILGGDGEAGVSDILSGRANWRDAVQVIGNLHFITAGPVDDSIAEYESSGAMAEFFYDMRREFDLVIVDSPPVLAVVDTPLIGTYCDGAIMMVQRDISRVPMFRQARNELLRYGIDILGTVFIGVQSALGYRQPYYYSDYGSEGRGQKRSPR